VLLEAVRVANAAHERRHPTRDEFLREGESLV
jgi:hypothetical protein